MKKTIKEPDISALQAYRPPVTTYAPQSAGALGLVLNSCLAREKTGATQQVGGGKEQIATL